MGDDGKADKRKTAVQTVKWKIELCLHVTVMSGVDFEFVSSNLVLL